MKNFIIRDGVTNDLSEVLALEKSIAEAPHWTEAAYAAVIDSRDDPYLRRCLFVAVQELAVIGFAVGKLTADVAELESLAVAAAARRGGVGKALCDAVIQWSRRQNAAAIELEVRAASGPATALYRRLGFSAIGRRPRYYSHPVDDAVLMRLDLLKSG